MRNFANRYHRQMVNGFAGDLPPVDPMAAGLVFNMALDRQDDSSQTTWRVQGYFVSNVALLTAALTLWLHGAGTDWIQVGLTLPVVGQNVSFESAGAVYDGDVFVQMTPSVPLGPGDTIDLYLEELD